MTSPFTQEHPAPSAAHLDREVRVELAARLAGDSPIAELVHVVLAIMAAILIWPVVPNSQAFAWVAAISLAALLRGILRARRRKDNADPALTVRTIRIGVAVLSLSWGLGVLVIAPTLPLEHLGLLTVIMSGIVAGATIALLADEVSFRILLVGQLLPLAAGMLLNGNAHLHIMGSVLIATFGGSMLVYYRRSHAAMLNQIRTTQQLAITTREAKAAQEQAEQMVRIVEATTDHVRIVGPEGQVRYMNRAGRAMLGISADEDLSGRTFRDLTPTHIHNKIEYELLPTIRNEGTWSGESLLQHRDGHEIPVSAVAMAHRDAENRVESISIVARDVTEQAAARKALQRARDSAEQMAAAKSAFLANTSHEIRTPLNGILGMVELLLDTELTPAQRRSAELISSSGETLLNTINDVLDLSKIEAGQMELEDIPFDLHNLVHSTVRLLISRATAKHIELLSDVDSSVPQRVVGDPHRLRQVLTNLIGNAVKFTHSGEVVVSVRRVDGDDARTRIRIGIRDTGIGVPAEHVERIFDPFRQVDTSTTRQYGGTGLGLSISRRLVRMMGATLAVESTAGKGSDFHFTVEWDVAPDSAAETQRTVGSMRGVRALVVDDHPVNRRIMGDMLRWAGSDVQEVESVDAALDALRNAARNGAPVSIVVSDVQMPKRDGFDLAAELRAEARLRPTSIMLLTSAGRPGDDQKCRELGVAAYMQKPVSRVELVEAALAAIADGAAKTPRRSLVTRIKLDETRRKLHVLIAEDNPVNQEVAASMLRKRGHEVEIVGNGREAVEAVRRTEFDVVLMDIQMPEQDGLSATREIRAMGGAYTSLAIHALTASVSAVERERCAAAGMSGYLAKPFKAHELFAQVEGWSPDHRPITGDQAVIAPAPVDLDGFTAMLADAGIPEAGGKMIAAFLEDAPPRVADMRNAADAGNLETVATHAHRVASGAASIYARELARLLRDAESAARDRNVAAAQSAARGAAQEFQRVESYLLKTSEAPARRPRAGRS